MKRIISVCLLVLALFGVSLASAAPSSAQPDEFGDLLEEYAPDWFGPLQYEDVIVMLTPGSDIDLFVNSVRGFGGVVSQEYDRVFNGFAASLPGWVVDILEGYPEVITVDPDVDVTVAAQSTPTGVRRTFTDTNSAIGIDGVDDKRVAANVAVIDTGIWVNHPDLNVVSSVNCASFGGCGGASNDNNGHGTHVAGTIGALDNGIGVVGVAPGVALHNIQVLDDFGRGYLSWVIAGINRAISLGNIDVINMSLSCTCNYGSFNNAVTSAVNNGIVVVAAAGNSGTDGSGTFPGAHSLAIGVSALADFDGSPGGSGSPTCRSDVDDTLANFSNYGSTVDIIAPGVCIDSTFVNNGYRNNFSGTSMAAPHVAGAAAILASQGYASNTIKQTLIDNGNYNWTDESNDGFKEPLLDLSNSAVFTPVTVDGPEAPAGPTASFTQVCTYLSCEFTDTSSPPASATITGWSWDFDNGGGTVDSTAQGPTQVFPGAGTYQVELTVTDSNADSDSITIGVTVAANGTPTAGFNRSCDYLACTFTDTSTDDGTLSWAWDFDNGGGSPDSTSQNPTNTYAAGTHTAKLTVTDDGGESASTTETFTLAANTAPTANFTVNCPSNSRTCTFTDTSTDDSPQGGVTKWEWDFENDGVVDETITTAPGDTSHTYPATDAETVKLTVTDNKGLTNSTTKSADPGDPPPNPLPQPSFTYTCDHYDCDFTDTSTDEASTGGAGSIASWSWSFGTGEGVSTTQSPSHTFSAIGPHTVTLTVVDTEAGTSAPPASQSVTIIPNPTPTADFDWDCDDLDCTFTDTSTDDGTISWSWDFGDGGSTVDSTAQNPTHTYGSGASRTVTLTVTDDDGASHSYSESVVSEDPPVPPIGLTASRGGSWWLQSVTLNWTGVIPGNVDIYRNGSLFQTTGNDGSQSISLGWFNFTTYTWRVCHSGTNVCSPDRNA